MPRTAVVALLTLSLAACGAGGEEQQEPPAETPAAGATQTSQGGDPGEATSDSADTGGTIVDSGFGQRDEFVWVTAIVKNEADSVGQTATVNFNVLDANGDILASESQVEGFSLPEAEHIIGTLVMLNEGDVAADLEVALHVEDHGAFGEEPFTALSAGAVSTANDEYGGQIATFELTNQTADNVTDPRVQVACFDADGGIIGGGSAYPDLVPANGRIKAEVDIITNGDPSSCDSFVGTLGWSEDPPVTVPSAEPSEEDGGSAEEAFQSWVEQFNNDDWEAHYATLINAQRAVISESEYVACRSAEDTPQFEWQGVTSTESVDALLIPGTAETAPATRLWVQLGFEGMSVPIDAHMLMEDGVWKWSMTSENLAGCVG